MEMIRTFHPVGQGAFYTEKFQIGGKPFTVVYDCGNRGCMSKVRSVVEDAFAQSEYIDILFLSHFDADHVSLISHLKPYQTGHIRKVVLPLLYSNIRYALAGYYLSVADRRAKNDVDRQIELILDPRKFFGNADIVFVRPDKEFADIYHAEQPTDHVHNETVYGSLDTVEITVDSRHNVMDDSTGWMLIPFNFDFKNRYYRLMSELVEWLRLRHAKMEDLGRIEFVNDRSNRRSLKMLYDKLGGGINENSMLLYSGPSSRFSGEVISSIDYLLEDEHMCNLLLGCIYTGDSNLKLFDLESVYRQFIPFVGTIQVSHHGSKESFCQRHYPRKVCLYPISYGIHNIYGHPDPCVKLKLGLLGGDCVSVTEQPATKLSESFVVLPTILRDRVTQH